MEPENNTTPTSGDFGMTEEDLKNYKLKSFLGRIKYYLSVIEPGVVKVLNTLIYWTIKFTKSFVSQVFHMIKGG